MELENTKNQEVSEDSLDLNINTIREAIELQELKEALRTISQRYERDKENILRDCEESRQDIEAQMFRLKQERAYMDSVNKDLQKHLIEVSKEKEALEKELIQLHALLDRLKDSRSPRNIADPKSVKGFVRSETEVTSSVELDFTTSIDSTEKYNSLPHRALPEEVLEQFNEISLEIRKNHLIDSNTANTVILIKHTLAHMLNIKKIIDEELANKSTFKEVSKNLSDIFSKLRLRVKNVEEESMILSRRFDGSDFYSRVHTEPGARSLSGENNELIYYYKKQLQIEKSKVLEKKHVIKLHKEQISFLKVSLREMQEEINRNKSVNESNKHLLINILTEIPVLAMNTENMIELLQSNLKCSSEEINKVKYNRKSKRPMISQQN